MKTTNRFTSAINSAATIAINVASGIMQELRLPDGETEMRFRLAPYGNFPVTDINGKRVTQVIDRKAGELIAMNFSRFGPLIAMFSKGVPIYEGHADDPEWAQKNPGHKAIAVGRIKSIENGEDGIYATSVLNSGGIALLGGEAPSYSGHSPHWRMTEIPGRKDCYRPVLLWSTALTNTPNIPGNSIALNAHEGVDMDAIDEQLETSPASESSEASEQPEPPQTTTTMKLTADALKALGFAPDAEPSSEEISAAILKMFAAKTEAENAQASAQGETTAANSEIDRLKTEMKSLLDDAVGSAITDAINTGRITEADKDKWTTALNTSFLTEKAKLDALMPTLNTSPKVDVKDRRAEHQTDALNAASRIHHGVTAYAADKGIDISTAKGWDTAYNACRTDKPELFEKG